MIYKQPEHGSYEQQINDYEHEVFEGTETACSNCGELCPTEEMIKHPETAVLICKCCDEDLVLI